MLLMAAGQLNTQAQTSDPESLDSFLARTVVPLRSLSAGDDDFSDLEPLAEAIGAARIVQLGEQSHGAGASFEARVRLIKFLHQRMGFDVVIWESGLYEMRDVDAALRAGADVSVAAEQGIFPVWS
jgi:erythromycin esterase-like protein